jgi:uncharacterized membrane protein YdbT with pleckstrin-like domain
MMLAHSHDRYLGQGERVMLEVRRHYALLLRPFALTLAVILGAAGLGSLTSPERGDHPVDTILGLLTLAFAAWFAWRALEWWLDRVVVTDERMFEVSGILTRKVAALPLSKLTDLTYRRTVWGRVFGYGDLSVETPGQDQALTHIDFLPQPDAFYRTLTSLVMKNLWAHAQGPSSQRDAPSERGDEDTGPLPRVIV